LPPSTSGYFATLMAGAADSAEMYVTNYHYTPVIPFLFISIPSL
jgi:hypothetical protein